MRFRERSERGDVGLGGPHRRCGFGNLGSSMSATSSQRASTSASRRPNPTCHLNVQQSRMTSACTLWIGRVMEHRNGVGFLSVRPVDSTGVRSSRVGPGFFERVFDALGGGRCVSDCADLASTICETNSRNRKNCVERVGPLTVESASWRPVPGHRPMRRRAS